MAKVPPQFAKANTDAAGPDAQDKKVGAMHKTAHVSNKAQRNALHSAGKKGK